MADYNVTIRQAPAARKDGTERLRGKQKLLFLWYQNRARRSGQRGLDLSRREGAEDPGHSSRGSEEFRAQM